MSIKRLNKLHPNHLVEMKIKDSQQNLQEFTLMLAQQADFSTFDILSITRADESAPYTYATAHRRVDTQEVRVASHSAKIIPWPGKPIQN